MERKKSGISARLKKSFLQVTIIMGIAAAIGIVALYVVVSQYVKIVKYYAFPQGDIGGAMTAFAEARSSLRGAIGYDEQDVIDEMIAVYEENKVTFEAYLPEIEKTMVTEAGHKSFDAIMAALDGYWELSDEILKEGAVTDRAKCLQAQERAINELKPKYEAVYGALADLMAVNVTKGDETEAAMQVVMNILIALMIVIVVVSVFISMKIGNNIAKGISVPLEEIGKRLGEFSHGDLKSPFPEIHTGDEVEEIANDCKDMASNLHTIIADSGRMLGEMAEGNFAVSTDKEEKYEGYFHKLLDAMYKLKKQMNTTLNSIDEAAEQVTDGSGQLAHSAQELAEGATEQAGAIEELTATIENVTNISEESAENSKLAAAKAKESSANAGKSREDMLELTGAMERITETSKEIENIIAAIEDIASQTNLLSLNASIEAARAGEAGRGFAVVADQIGKLAADSAQSAVTTKELIEKSLVEIEKGNQIVQDTTDTISEVLASMDEFAGMASGAAEASQVQADMLEEIKGGIEQISIVIQSNSAAAEQTSAISEELSAQAISLKSMVDAFNLEKE